MNINDIKNALSTRAANVAPAAHVQMETNNITTVSTPSANMSAPTVKTKEKTATKTTKKRSADKTEPIEAIVASVLVPNQDYGMIPGCRKPSLLKSGAEKLCSHYGYSTQISIIHRAEIYEKGFVSYEVKVTIYSPSGSIHAEGVGAANSRERKFLKGDFFSQINTVLKIAKKRAYVDAILTATGASGIFTQDMEDISSGTTDNRMEAIG